MQQLVDWIAINLDGTERVSVVTGGRTRASWIVEQDIDADPEVIAGEVLALVAQLGAESCMVRLWVGAKASSRTFAVQDLGAPSSDGPDEVDAPEEAAARPLAPVPAGPRPSPARPQRRAEVPAEVNVPLQLFLEHQERQAARYDRLVDRALGAGQPALDAMTRALDVNGRVLERTAAMHHEALDQAQEAQRAAQEIATSAVAAAPELPVVMEAPADVDNGLVNRLLEQLAPMLVPIAMQHIAGAAAGGGLLGAAPDGGVGGG
ncbi:hypothetical protein L6R50_14790 [Myxococcota bacterium]|nr:hypothetical protein [Myxococcota bacterium]